MSHTNQLTELKLEILSQCPLNCVHCSSESTSERRELVDPAQIAKLVKEFISLGGNQIQISGGEPLEHPSILDILGILREENLAIILYTSGLRACNGITTIHPEMAMILKRHVRSVVFSLHGGGSEAHDAFTKTQGSFEATLESIAACRAASIDVAVHFVPTQANYQSLPELIHRLRKLKIKRISLLRFVPHGRGSASSLALNAEQLLELRSMVEELSEELSIYMRLGSPFSVLQTADVPTCHAGIDRMLVTPDGTAYPCDAFKGFPFDDPCQNVYRDSLERVWKNSTFFKTVRRIERRLPTACTECTYQHSCHGGCPAQRAFEYGKLDDKIHPDPCCLKYPALFPMADYFSGVKKG